MSDKYTLLQRYWGYKSFRPLQEDIVDTILKGGDCLALLPTGGGKSLCFQLPTLMMEGLCLVISPLIALMRDQVQRLNERHIAAACIVSGMGQNEVRSILNNSIAGRYKFLYVSPERLRQRLFIEHYRKMRVCLIAVDEAHCISQWGYDFRPPYLQIAEIRQYHPQVPIVALTASATPTVAEDICRQLRMRRQQVFRSTFVRENLAYRVVNDESKTPRLIQLVRSIGGSGIVYTRSRRVAHQVSEMLQHEGISSTFYHAGLSSAERSRKQQQWMSGERRVMVATNAFGMGIDKADVRFVVHLDVPESMEAYYQEAGRAGRDGKPAWAYLLYSEADKDKLRINFNDDFPTLAQIRNIYRALCNYYRIPVGAGADARYNFSLETICQTYAFSPRVFYSACRFLEREGLVSLPEREDSSSMIYVPISRDEIYHFQVNHLRLGGLLQSVLRACPGVMNLAVPVNEAALARNNFVETSEIIAMLNELHAMHVVDYRQCPKQPQIVFTAARVDDSAILLASDSYVQLKQVAAERLQTMIKYAEEQNLCRREFISAYFGETEGVGKCGICDVCLAEWGKGEGESRAAILKTLENTKLGVHQLRMILEEKGFPDVRPLLRTMLDEGTLYLDKNLLLSIS